MTTPCAHCSKWTCACGAPATRVIHRARYTSDSAAASGQHRPAPGSTADRMSRRLQSREPTDAYCAACWDILQDGPGGLVQQGDDIEEVS